MKVTTTVEIEVAPELRIRYQKGASTVFICKVNYASFVLSREQLEHLSRALPDILDELK